MKSFKDLSYGLFLSDRQLDFLFNYPQGFDRMKCFATFLRMAVTEPTHYEKKEYSVDLTPGQFAISEVELAKLWKCNRKTASKMVDLFHEMGLVSSVPNFRTTIFTVHCIASWYIEDRVIKNLHYSRHIQLEKRIKANHKTITSNVLGSDNTPSLDKAATDIIESTHQSDDRTNDSRDEYIHRKKDKTELFISDRFNEGGSYHSSADATESHKSEIKTSLSTIYPHTIDNVDAVNDKPQSLSQHTNEHKGDAATKATPSIPHDNVG